MKTLQQLCIQHHSDKHNHHDYARHYDFHFRGLRGSSVSVLELGIGGYEFPDRGGSGLRVWSDYFQRGKIYGLDFYDKSGITLPPRTKIYQGSQDDGDFLLKVMSEIGRPDIIIDDASHMNSKTIQSFKHLFPWLRPGGIYVIEDIESSWWEDHGFDGDKNFKNMHSKTTVNFCRALVNEVNAKHIPDNLNPVPIDSIHFYQNMVVIIKK